MRYEQTSPASTRQTSTNLSTWKTSPGACRDRGNGQRWRHLQILSSPTLAILRYSASLKMDAGDLFASIKHFSSSLSLFRQLSSFPSLRYRPRDSSLLPLPEQSEEKFRRNVIINRSLAWYFLLFNVISSRGPLVVTYRMCRKPPHSARKRNYNRAISKAHQ